MKRQICVSLLLLTMIMTTASLAVAETHVSEIDQRVRGLLIGSFLGDAAGGPPEFQSAEDLKRWLPDLRSWSPERFRSALQSDELKHGFELLPYAGIRPAIAPYGPWEKDAAAGTVTDDSRHKMVLLHCMADFLEDTSAPISKASLARAYVAYGDTHAARGRHDYQQLTSESFREYVSVANWILGQRDLAKSLPPQRLWAGIATCSGQMTFPPLAALYPGDPDAAYRATFAIDFVDVGPAKDISAALVAALAVAIGSEHKPEDTWPVVWKAVRETDPYRYGQVPFAKRPATEWLDFALDAAARAQGSPRELFRILENEGRPRYYWDAHFTFATAIACLKFCDYRPLEAITVSLAFGHDTDSAAQVIGALAGAVHGPQVFPARARRQVQKRLLIDYGEDVDSWVRVLRRVRDRGNVIRFLEQEPTAATTSDK